MKSKPSTSYKKHLLKELTNPKEASGYLSACFQDEDPRVFLLALKDVADAQGGMTQLSRRTHISREHLYSLFSKKGNPSLKTLNAILDVLGFQLSIRPKPKKRAA